MVYKLRHNKKLTSSDMQELERILWEELGTKEDYQKEYGNTPVGILSIVEEIRNNSEEIA